MPIKKYTRKKGSNKHPTEGRLVAEKKGANRPSIDTQSTPNKEVEIEVPPWRCPLCDLLPEKVLRRVEVTWAEGRLDHPRKLSLARYLLRKHANADAHTVAGAMEAIDRHVDVCLQNANRSRYARVAEQFNMLWEALHVAHRVYVGSPDMFSATSYAGFVKQLRGLMADLDKVQNAAELGEDLTRLAINPLVRTLTNTIISEMGRLKEELSQHVPETVADRMTNEVVARIATPFTRAAHTAGEEIEATLAARDKNRVAAVSGRKAMKRSTGKKTPLRVVK